MKRPVKVIMAKTNQSLVNIFNKLSNGKLDKLLLCIYGYIKI